MNYEQGLPDGVTAWPGVHCGLGVVVPCGLGGVADGIALQGSGVGDPAAPAWQPGCVVLVLDCGVSGDAGWYWLAVSGAGVPFGETLCCGVYRFAFGIVAEGAVVVVVPEVVAPEVVVPDVVVPAVVAPPVAPVCAQATPPASTVTASANVAFLRSYLMERLLLFAESNVGVAAMFRKIYRVSVEPFRDFMQSHASVNSSRSKLVL